LIFCYVGVINVIIGVTTNSSIGRYAGNFGDFDGSILRHEDSILLFWCLITAAFVLKPCANLSYFVVQLC